MNWKKISCGLPRAGKAANDRAPTKQEIQKLIEYPDRRIKPVVYTMLKLPLRYLFVFLKGTLRRNNPSLDTMNIERRALN